MTPEEVGRRLLGPVLLARLQRHCAPPLLEDLCGHVAAVAAQEREACAALADRDAEVTLDEAQEQAGQRIAEAIRARGTP